MSASEPETCIFTIDSPGDVKRKVWNAFTGGKGTAAEKIEAFFRGFILFGYTPGWAGMRSRSW
jgi:hypothetical protein